MERRRFAGSRGYAITATPCTSSGSYHRVSMPGMRTSRSLLTVIAGLTCLVVALAAIISIAVVSQSALRISNADPRAADARFEEAKRQFPDEQALLEMADADGHRRVVLHHRQPAATASVTMVRGLAWRASDEALAEVELPFWFVRMKLAGGRVTLGALLPRGWDVVRVSADDLVQHGPGLLIDERAPNGDRLLLWAE